MQPAAVLSRSSSILALNHGQRKSLQSHVASRATCRRSKSCRLAVVISATLQVDSSTSPSWKETLNNDLKYISSAHDKVVQALNPEEREMHELQQKMEALQAELARAHGQIHRSEEVVDKTLSELKQLEQVVAGLHVADVAAAPMALPTVSPPQPQPRAPSTEPSSSKSKRNNGLKSSLKIEPELKNFWYPIQFTAKLVPDVLEPIELFDETWVLFRDEAGKAACIRDECAHRACPLSLGTIKDGKVTCAYHGWEFNGAGACEKMPSTRFCKGVEVRSLPIVERDGLVFVWTGEEGEPDIEVPDLSPPKGYVIHSEIVLDVPVEHGLLVENLLDLAHAPFTHTATFARGWPIPEMVKFHLLEKLGGNWDPYPIDMSFLPPVMTVSTIGLNQPGKIERGMRCEECSKHLHQLHVNLPAKEGRTRLLYRMSLDFLGWVRYVPGIQLLWKQVANQVLGEDLRLVLGQQDRMQRGGDTWGFPVPYDKLAVRYRRWRNNLGSAAAAPTRAAEITMNAGELFMEDEECDTCSITESQPEAHF
mmetsp:Transcript_45722/g.76194  ORF Transcript_45722/g.76194 Transcript_45722/m.76194 type:complete len:536 (+) Transcript_45722:248-1855(+)|eukprot:CAMPEP_0198217156 /NCGR_PEP_ID=MMETSP1445-20131203/61924_1 /TAXON_ID=36898 /ORGANISM="Pyramimonas sp., Strain CCMP2087" /LENGTH=535 /DNA_ID=CAMNT_0043893707 /DNA_START=224 /DNA_END=1831 /DNA_ORIENTATION=+